MNSLMVRLLAALRFLTILPLPWQAEKDGEILPDSLAFFVPAGIVIGCGGFLVVSLFRHVLPQPLLACVAVVYLGAISAFLHLDGLADCGDALFSARPRRQKLEIMKDSRTGAMGVVCLVLTLLVKVTAIQSLPPEHLAAIVFFLPVAGRYAIVLSMSFLPYAREEGGLGGLISTAGRWPAVGSGLAITCGAALLLEGVPLLSTLAVLLLTVYGWSIWCRSSLGGMTGDTLGAACELSETMVAISCAAFFYMR